MNQNEVLKYFEPNDEILSGGGNATANIIVINETHVILKTSNNTKYYLRYDKLSLLNVLFNELENRITESNDISNSVRDLLNQNGLEETSAEVYLYGFLKIYRKKAKIEFASKNDLIDSYDGQMKSSLNRTKEERKKRLENSSKKPLVAYLTSKYYIRNADVIVDVLERANGKCEICKQPAPFNRDSDGSPYLEVHHILPLSEDGDDTVENAQALCPNCHRKSHFGKNEID